jgi:hypothetical protein
VDIGVTVDVGVAGRAGAERRATPRVAATHAAACVKAWLRPGAEIRLIDLSSGGAQIECARRLVPGARVDLQVHTGAGRFVLAGRLVRVEVAALRPDAVRYRAGLAFETASVSSAASLARSLQGSGYPPRPTNAGPTGAAGPPAPRPRGAPADGTPFGSGKSLSRVLG